MCKLNIVLVEPRIPQNTGNIARTCAVTGARLHLVRPLGFEPSDKELKRAGLDYWHFLDITYYDNLADFFTKTAGGVYFYFTTKGRQVHSDVAYPDNAYLVFGREDAGLPEKLLYENPSSCVRIPMLGDARSLNLSNSGAKGVYEVLRGWGNPKLKNEGRLTQYDWSEAL
jgi:tRNA (cytidine/uridine-2'-O-)-methyltransferase